MDGYDNLWTLMVEFGKEEKMNNTEPKKFWMITGDGNQPKKRHYDYGNAKAEAFRLAQDHPGIEFYVLEATEIFHQPTGVIQRRF